MEQEKRARGQGEEREEKGGERSRGAAFWTLQPSPKQVVRRASTLLTCTERPAVQQSRQKRWPQPRAKPSVAGSSSVQMEQVKGSAEVPKPCSISILGSPASFANLSLSSNHLAPGMQGRRGEGGPG